MVLFLRDVNEILKGQRTKLNLAIAFWYANVGIEQWSWQRRQWHDHRMQNPWPFWM